MQFFTIMYAMPNGDVLDDIFCLEEVFTTAANAEQGIIDHVNSQSPFHPKHLSDLTAAAAENSTREYAVALWIPIYWVTEVNV